MFSFFKRWRNKDKADTTAEQQIIEDKAVEAGTETTQNNQESVSPSTVSAVEMNTIEPEYQENPVPNDIEQEAIIQESLDKEVTCSTNAVNVVDTAPVQGGEDEKVRIHFTLSDALPPISDEELEKAALAEIPEDSPLRYQVEEEKTDIEDLAIQSVRENTSEEVLDQTTEDTLEQTALLDSSIAENIISNPVELPKDNYMDFDSLHENKEQTTDTPYQKVSIEENNRVDFNHTQEIVVEENSLNLNDKQASTLDNINTLSENTQENTYTDIEEVENKADNTDKHHTTEERIEEEVFSATPPAEKASWLSRLKKGLARTGSNISSLFVGVKVDEDLFEELETALIMADAGIEATQSLLSQLRAKVKKERIEDAKAVKQALYELVVEHLKPLEKRFTLDPDITNVVMLAGVNGAGKTTSIGKLAHHFQASGASVLLAAGDTFRAAAREQLIEWGARNNVQVIAQDGGDPAAVAFDAVNAGKARKTTVVMVDTAGRLPTQTHLMQELKKIHRVITKAESTAPHEVLLVIDGNTGQNALAQIKAFDAVLGLTGLIVTKLDGTAKGGILAAVASGSQGVRPVPVYWIGVGESLHDLQPFVASEFASALLGDE
ncbi:signal recognition particle-docking protein FtsY [Pelistega ratti]|uniref:signal recognition particle-docking protein FtsY n=1 Tax=Pelistega ratti TaxID=2652177 RepID=UPI0039A6AAF5